jgi:hypothetical protein
MNDKIKSILNTIGLCYLLALSVVIIMSFLVAFTSEDYETIITINNYGEANVELIIIITGIIPMVYFINSSIDLVRKQWFNSEVK